MKIARGTTVSVLLPVFNGGKLITSTLKSLEDQTFRDFQVIIIDDGSTDNTREICADFCRNDDKFIYFWQKNGGVSAARNAGLKMATGKYVTYVDADDWVEADTLQSLVELAETRNADVVFCQSIRQRVLKPLGTQAIGTVFTVENKDTLKYNFGNIRQRSMALFKHDILKDIYFAEDISFSEDLLFIVSVLAKAKRAVSDSRCRYHYFQHDASTLHKAQGLKFFASNVCAHQRIYQIARKQEIAKQDEEQYYLDFCKSVFSLLRYGAKAGSEKVYENTRQKYEKEIKYCLARAQLSFARRLKFASYYYCPFWLVKLLHGWRKYDVKKENS